MKRNMKSVRNIAAMIVLFSIAGVTTAIGGNPKSVVVTNNTSYTMTEFYASSSDSSSWDSSANLFAGQTLAPGQQTTINISDGGDDDECQYDLMAVLTGTTQHAYIYGVNTCGNGTATWSISGL
jgi:hypothetical protein